MQDMDFVIEPRYKTDIEIEDEEIPEKFVEHERRIAPPHKEERLDVTPVATHHYEQDYRSFESKSESAHYNRPRHYRSDRESRKSIHSGSSSSLTSSSSSSSSSSSTSSLSSLEEEYRRIIHDAGEEDKRGLHEQYEHEIAAVHSEEEHHRAEY